VLVEQARTLVSDPAAPPNSGSATACAATRSDPAAS
jgi:hypothetical protein